MTHLCRHLFIALRLSVLVSLSLTGLGSSLAVQAMEEPLPPEQAFRVTAHTVDANTIEARWQIADGYYLYRDKFKFELEPATAKLGTFNLPPGKVKDDENFGKVETYRHELIVRLPFTAPAGAVVSLKVTSQGCADLGICYPPLTAVIPLKASLASVFSSAPAASTPIATPITPDVESTAPENTDNEQGQLARLLRHGSLWLILSTFFGLGLLLSFTPCMLPMVPILSSIIVHHGHGISHSRAFVLSSAYSLGMALTYAAAGVAAGLSGTLLSGVLQNVWVLGGFALIFVALALSMFGFYELQLPTAIQSKLSDTANRQGGSLGSIALMGALSAVIVGPCVAPPLAAALLYIAQTGNAVLGGWALFFMALGMGLPLVLVGTFSRSLLPKTGPWMEAVKKFFGVLLLATALWLVGPVLPAWLVMATWALLLIVPAIYLRALDSLPPHSGNWQRFWKGIGIVLLLAGTAMLAGLFAGSRDPLQPLDFLRSGATSNAPHFETVKSVADLDQKITAAKTPVLLDFYADWCKSCIEMERFTFSDPQVAKQLSKFTLLRADVTANSADDALLLKRFSLFGPPGIIFFGRGGKELEQLRVIGYQTPDVFMPTLTKALQ